MLKAFDFRATIGTVVPALLAADASYMTTTQFLKMCEAGHTPIHHTGGGAYGGAYGWDNVTKFPDATVSAAVQADVEASWAQFRSWGYATGVGYGGVGWTNGFAPSATLARRAGILAGLRAAGMIKLANSDTYRGPYFGNKDNGIMATPITQMAWNGAYTTGVARLHDLCARGGWTGFRFHNVKVSGGSGNDVSVADATFLLEALAEAVSAGKCVVLPFHEAMPYLDSASLTIEGGY